MTPLSSKLYFTGVARKRHIFLRAPPHKAKLRRQLRAESGASARGEGSGHNELLEQFRRDVAGTVDDADDENAVFFRAVEDQVVADRKGAETGEKMIDRTPQVRLPDELTDDGAEAVDEAIRRIGIVPCDLDPNLNRVQLRLIARLACPMSRSGQTGRQRPGRPATVALRFPGSRKSGARRRDKAGPRREGDYDSATGKVT